MHAESTATETLALSSVTKSAPPIPGLVDRHGRKYLTATERDTFLTAARRAARPEIQTLALTLTLSGCRISEALALRPLDVDLEQQLLRIQTLKRRADAWREVPVPAELIRSLELVHRLRTLKRQHTTATERLWPISRASASRHIRQLMHEAKIRGPQACPKGLRHGFGIAAVAAGVPLPTLAAVLGHSSITTTAIYATAAGNEAREQLGRMW